MEAPWGDAGLRRLALLLALACGLLAGCGGDDAADGPLSKAEYEKRFNVVIQESERRGERLGSPKSESGEELGRFLDRASESTERVSRELGALEPPREVASAHKDYVAGIAATGDGLKEVADAARRGDRSALSKGPISFVDRAALDKLVKARRTFAQKKYDLGDATQLP